MLPVEQPFKTYTGLDGKALHNGYVYFGVAGGNPITAPVTVYWDAAGTQPAQQPLRTTNGYIVRAGTPANVFFSGAYSELVQDAQQRQVFYARTSVDFSIATVVQNFITSLASSIGSSLIGFIQAGIGAVLRTAQDKLRERVSVADFGAVCDGVTDDRAAVIRGDEYLKTRGGGTLYFPGRCYIGAAINLSGVVTGGSSYTTPSLPKITWEGNGESGILSGIAAGDVIRFSSPTETLGYTPAFKNFLIDCGGNNVTAINGMSQAGLFGPNHYTDIDGLRIVGIAGAAATGIDFGTITDSKVQRVEVQGSGAGAFIAYRVAKANVKFVDCYGTYCTRMWSIRDLPEAAVVATGGGSITNGFCLYWEPVGAAFYSSATILTGVFLGEATNGGLIVGAASPGTIDVGSVTFHGCAFDTYRPGQDLMTINFGGRFTITGCNCWSGSTGLTTVDLGQFAETTWYGNTNMTIKPGCQALALDKVNKFADKTALNFYAVAVPGAAGNFLMSKDASSITDIVMPFPGSLVGFGVQASAALAAGSLDLQMEINHAGIGGATVTLNTGSFFTTRTIPAGQYAYVAGDRIGLRCYKNGVIAPAPFDLSVQLIVQT